MARKDIVRLQKNQPYRPKSGPTIALLPGLTLPLLVACFLADHTHTAIAPDYLAVTTQFFNRSPDFHFSLLSKFTTGATLANAGTAVTFQV